MMGARLHAPAAEPKDWRVTLGWYESTRGYLKRVATYCEGALAEKMRVVSESRPMVVELSVAEAWALGDAWLRLREDAFSGRGQGGHRKVALAQAHRAYAAKGVVA